MLVPRGVREEGAGRWSSEHVINMMLSTHTWVMSDTSSPLVDDQMQIEWNKTAERIHMNAGHQSFCVFNISLLSYSRSPQYSDVFPGMLNCDVFGVVFTPSV